MPLFSASTSVYFYPRPPCGGRRPLWSPARMRTYFYPRPPCGGRHVDAHHHVSSGEISIHALRVEGDQSCWQSRAWKRNFYPRPPCGGRLVAVDGCGGLQLFLSTPSVWRATGRVDGRLIHDEFLSTPSVWRATAANAQNAVNAQFLSTPSVWRATRQRFSTGSPWRYFYPRPPCGGRPFEHVPGQGFVRFLSTPSVWRATRGWRPGVRSTRFLSTPSVWRATRTASLT